MYRGRLGSNGAAEMTRRTTRGRELQWLAPPAAEPAAPAGPGVSGETENRMTGAMVIRRWAPEHRSQWHTHIETNMRPPSQDKHLTTCEAAFSELSVV